MAYYNHFYSEKNQISKFGEWIVNAHNTFFLKLIFSFLDETKDIRILEIGPGKGYFAKQCSRYKNVFYFAIERNESQAVSLKEQGFNVEHSNVPPIKKPSDNFNAIFMSQVLEHMKDGETAISLMNEASRILKNKGIIIIISPDCISFKFDFFDVDYTHSFVTSLRRIRQLLEDNNFELVYSNYFAGPFMGKFLSFIVSGFIRTLYATRIPFLFAWNRNMSEKIYKIKLSFLRKLLIIGKKNA